MQSEKQDIFFLSECLKIKKKNVFSYFSFPGFVVVGFLGAGKGKSTDKKAMKSFSFTFTKFPTQTKPNLLQKMLFQGRGKLWNFQNIILYFVSEFLIEKQSRTPQK